MRRLRFIAKPQGFTILNMPTEKGNDQETDPTDAPDATSGTDAPTGDPPDADKVREELNQSKKRESAARKKMDETQIENKRLKEENERLKKAVTGGETPPPESLSPDTPVTRQEFDERTWLIEHRKDVDLYGDEEYQEDVKSGVPRDKALKYAKLRYESMDDSAKRERQKAISSTVSTNRTIAPDDEIVITPEQKRRGITKEMIKKHKAEVERTG